MFLSDERTAGQQLRWTNTQSLLTVHASWSGRIGTTRFAVAEHPVSTAPRQTKNRMTLRRSPTTFTAKPHQ